MREDNTGKVFVARMVGGIMSKVVAKDEAERKWSAEVQLLRQRLERSAVMQNMVQSLQQKEKTQQVNIFCLGLLHTLS